MKLVLERRYHSEITASTANRPEKIRVGGLAGFDLSAVHGQQLCRYQIVTGGAVFRHQQPLSAAERQAGNPHRWATTHRGGEAESLCCLVHIPHQGTGIGTGHALANVDLDLVHSGQIDHEAAVAYAESSAAV